MAMQTDLLFTTDLDKGVEITKLHPLLFSGDEETHRFIVTVTNEDISGLGVYGYFIRADEAMVTVEGTVDDEGRAVLLLSKPCYSFPGRYQLVIRVHQGDVKRTIFCGEGYMKHTTSDSIVDEENVIPSIDDLLAQIDRLEGAVENANTATSNANEAADNANEAAERANNAQGPTGATPNLTIGTVTTLAAGSPATAEITGTPEDPVLNLGIPRGVDGDGADGAVQSVNGKTGVVTLTAEDVSAAPAEHTHTAANIGALPISGGTLTGTQVVDVACVRNIYAGTEAMETGVSELATGVIYIQYE